ncbi:MAG: hypothetical protein CME68_06645 [Halobacteriovoraceae bacterium]|nr:hypothetical protein [Halobacteriovoraceae bacterium]
MKKKRQFFFVPLVTLILGLISLKGEGATNFFKITNINPPNIPAINAALSEFETTINNQLPSIESADLTKDTVNSNIISNKGVGVDYTNSMKRFLIGWSQSASVNVGSSENILSGAKTVKGFGMGTQFNLGFNLEPLKKRNLIDLPSFWRIDLNNSKVFMGLMTGKTSQKVSGYTLGFDIFTFNLRIMTKLKKAEDFKSYFFKWGGIDLSTGLEGNKTTLSVSVPRKDSITDSTNTYKTTFDGTVGFKVDSSSLSIPLEVSASATFFSFIDLFWGLGTDLNFGYGKGSSFSDSDVFIYDMGDNLIATADAEFNLGSTGAPSIMNVRWFTGTQVNLWKMKVALQAQHSIIQGIWGFGANFNFIF